MIDSYLQAEWQPRLDFFSRVYVGYSGGLDSTVLLHALSSIPELKSKIIAIHINHGLSVNANKWAQHCLEQAQQLGFEYRLFSADCCSESNVEEKARNARYNIFRAQLIDSTDALLLAHHQNDQAETLLFNLLRGAGVEGLAAMPVEKKLGQGAVFRPFLNITREALLIHAKEHELNWVEDESNADRRFSRNFIRHEVMPLIQSRWPDCSESLSRTAGLCQQAAALLNEQASDDLAQKIELKQVLALKTIKALSPARRNNVLRYWLKQNNIRMPSQKQLGILNDEMILAKQDASPMNIIDGKKIRRYRDYLYVDSHPSLSLPSVIAWDHFPNPIKIEGVGVITSIKGAKGFDGLVGVKTEIRFRQGGESFKWQGKTRALKKCMQDWGIPPWERNRVPLLYVDNHLAVIGEYAVSDLYRSETDGWFIKLTQVPTTQGS